MSEPHTTNEDRAWRAAPDLVVFTVEQQARRFYDDQRMERALHLYEKLVRMRPEASQYRAMVGIIYRRQQRLVKALKALERAVDLNPTNRNALVNLGESLILAGKPVEGTRVLRAVFEMGYTKGKPPADHDAITKRAGAQLAMLHDIADGVVEQADFGDVGKR